MESIGEKLRSTREAKRLNIRDVVKDTSISPIFIEALEDEDFDKFPSETYIIGYLKKYTEYLRLDPDEIIQAYKGYKIGESITPLEELTKPTKPSFSLFFSSFFNRYRNILIITGIISLVIAAIVGFKALVKNDIDVTQSGEVDHVEDVEDMKDKVQLNQDDLKAEKLRNLYLSNDRGSSLVYKKETVQFPVDNKEVYLLLQDVLYNQNQVKIKVLSTKQVETLYLDQEKKISLEGLKKNIFITLKSLTPNRAKLMVKLIQKEGVAINDTVQDFINEKIVHTTSVVAQNKSNLKIVFEAYFLKKSFIEIHIDGKQVRRGFIPQYSRERFEANEIIQMKIGNAGGLKARINGKNFVFGKIGEVANKTIKWKRDINKPNLYHIDVSDWQ